MTELYLRKKALDSPSNCCGNGCRHCPFDWHNVGKPKKSQDDDEEGNGGGKEAEEEVEEEEANHSSPPSSIAMTDIKKTDGTYIFDQVTCTYVCGLTKALCVFFSSHKAAGPPVSKNSTCIIMGGAPLFIIQSSAVRPIYFLSSTIFHPLSRHGVRPGGGR